MFEIGVALAIVCTIAASFFVGIIYTKRLLRNRYADVFEAFGQKDLAEQLRDDNPVVSYHLQVALLGAIVGLVISFVWVVAMFLTGQDLLEYRRALMPVLASSMTTGFLAAGV